MQIDLPFHNDMRIAILNGRKTCTSRTKSYGQSGDVFILQTDTPCIEHTYELMYVDKQPLVWYQLFCIILRASTVKRLLLKSGKRYTRLPGIVRCNACMCIFSVSCLTKPKRGANRSPLFVMTKCQKLSRGLVHLPLSGLPAALILKRLYLPVLRLYKVQPDNSVNLCRKQVYNMLLLRYGNNPHRIERVPFNKPPVKN